jgi:uroporphyrinogen decarboxylase
VQETAEQAKELVARKKQVASEVDDFGFRISDFGLKATIHNPQFAIHDLQSPWDDTPFMRACRRDPTDFTPVWLMRQAGRYMPEYRAIRERVSFLELCRNPQLCSQIMCTAVERLGVDAAIVFSDLLPILEPMGIELEFAHGEGPLIHNPVRESADVERVIELESADALHFVMEAVRQTRADLPAHIPLIGFAGAPFTLASYAIEGGASRDFLHTKTLMYRDRGAWDALMSRLARAVTVYLNAQIAAGAQAVQLFDSWAGCLGPDDYRQFVLPFVAQVVSQITPGVPVISFATGNPQLIPLLAASGAGVIGVDWRVRLDEAWQMIGPERAIQGNLDPMALLADANELRRRAADILQQAGGRPGHIFNLGHGVLPQTPVDHARALVDAVHELSAK